MRTPEEDEEGEQTLHEGTVFYRPPYTKVKLDLAYETDVPRFRLFEKQQDGKKTEVQLKERLRRHPAAYALHDTAPHGDTVQQAVRHEDFQWKREEEVWNHTEGVCSGVHEQDAATQGGADHVGSVYGLIDIP